MAKQKKIAKNKKNSKNSRLMGAGGGKPNKKVLFVLLSLIIISSAFWGLRIYFLENTMFRIKKVDIIGNQTQLGSNTIDYINSIYKDRNIFSIDLKHAAGAIALKHPTAKNIEIRKKYPDTLQVNILNRTPIACLNKSLGINIDSEGIIIFDKRLSEKLVDVEGVSFVFRAPEPGEKLRTREVNVVLDILRSLKENGISQNYKTTSIDVGDLKNINMVTSGLNVKLKQDSLNEQIILLRKILTDTEVDINDISYVDLRFEKPVISPKR
ncbi:MAG: FtsQ-type POTRA domain-containing protein [Candidatus Omnitrophica bacterium]|nr:FtsQ-type POTRA domain-containing protein [Candidatus Omnitrophota bacterium]